MNRADYLKLFTYSDNCWAQLRDVLTENPEAFNVSFETTSRWNTVRLLMAHAIAAEERWITLRLQDLPLPVMYEERAATTPDGLYEDFRTVRTATYDYLRSLSEAALVEENTVTLPQWNFRGGLTRGEVMFHIINHDNYHRGQVVMTLQRIGLDPPNFDYVFLKEPAPEDAAT